MGPRRALRDPDKILQQYFRFHPNAAAGRASQGGRECN
jgi:hypothetical protein